MLTGTSTTFASTTPSSVSSSSSSSEIAESGPSEAELIAIAEAVGFNYTAELLSLLREMEGLSDPEIEQRAERFIRKST